MILEQEDLMTIGDRIKKLRQEIGYTQAELARKMQMKPVQLTRYEKGRGNPSILTIHKIANILNVPIDFLVTGQDKSMAKKAALDDEELLDMLRRIAQLRGPQRDKIKWAIDGLLCNISNNGSKEEAKASSKS